MEDVFAIECRRISKPCLSLISPPEIVREVCESLGLLPMCIKNRTPARASGAWKKPCLAAGAQRIFRRSHHARSYLSARQSNSGLVTVDELNARSFQGASNGRQVVDRRNPAALFEIANSALAQIGSSSQFSLRPVEQSASCPRLIGGHPTAISWDTISV